VRKLIEEGRIPDDVTIIVLTQSREELIRRTVESVVGAKRAIVHLYNSVAPVFRKVVFGMSREEITNIATTGTKLVKELTAQHPDTEWGFEYTPESFSTTENWISPSISATPSSPSGADARQQDDHQPAIHRGMQHAQCLRRPDRVDVAQAGAPRFHHHRVHPHNDRGTAVARPNWP
jgi:2-isopropylmalate synthase